MKIAVVNRQGCLGDVVYAEPFIRALSCKYDIVVLDSPYRHVFDNHPFVSRRCDINMSNPEIYGYDIYDLNHSYEKYWFDYSRYDFVSNLYLEIFNMPEPFGGVSPQLYLSKEEIKWGYSSLGVGKWLIVDPGHERKVQFKVGCWNKLLSRIKSKLKVNIAAVGLAKFQEIKGFDIDFRGQTNIRQLFSLLNASDLFLGVESGAFVSAQALNKKGVVLIYENCPPEMILSPNSHITPIITHDYYHEKGYTFNQLYQYRGPLMRDLDIDSDAILLALQKHFYGKVA